MGTSEQYKILTAYCGDWDTFSLEIPSNKGAILLQSDDTGQDMGFRAEYFGISEDYNKVINDTEGFIDSPRYYNKYPNNVEYTVTIYNRPGSRLVLKFLQFDLDSSDFLEVQNGIVSNDSHTVNLTGNDLPVNIYCYGDGIRLKFKSDLTYSKFGYKINYTVEEIKECLDSVNGHNYIGTLNKALNGIKCIPWASTSASLYSVTEGVDLSENYCRNVDGNSSSPWCYISSTEKEFCSIEQCLLKIVMDKGSKIALYSEDSTDSSTSVLTTIQNNIESGTVEMIAKIPIGSDDKKKGKESSSPSFTVPIAVGCVSLIVICSIFIVLIVKRKDWLLTYQTANSVNSVATSDDRSCVTLDFKNGQVIYKKENVDVDSENIQYMTVSDALFDGSEETVHDTPAPGRKLLRSNSMRNSEEKRMAILINEDDGYGMVDSGSVESINCNLKSLPVERSPVYDEDEIYAYDHLTSFKLKRNYEDNDIDNTYDHCHVSLIQREEQDKATEDSACENIYDHTESFRNKIQIINRSNCDLVSSGLTKNVNHNPT